MVIHRKTGEIEHRSFREIPAYLQPHDVLVLNRTRVLPVRLWGKRAETGGRVEVVLIREAAPGLWEALLRPSRRLPPGSRLDLEDGALEAEVADGPDRDRKYVRFPDDMDVEAALQRVGHIPLPPYIQRDADASDRIRYQTVYADTPGAIAAPTAGLHFTSDLLVRIRSRGVAVIPILLHVGPGTFQPVRVDEVEDHKMEAEYYRVDEEEIRRISEVRRNGRIIAVGTTTVRTLETIAAAQPQDEESLEIRRYEGWTSRFIYPPYRFRLVEALLTNFHLPCSTLLMLVCAFAGQDLMLHAYEEAVRTRYRFYSYGDAMLIV